MRSAVPHRPRTSGRGAAALPPPLACAALAIALALAACGGDPGKSSSLHADDPGLDLPGLATKEPIEPLPLEVHVDARKVALGERLFADPALSNDGTVACTSCHIFSKGGADGLPRSHLSGRPEGKINVPTIFNVGYSFRFNWNGRFEALTDMIDAPIAGPAALSTSWADVIRKIAGSGEYRAAFEAIYGGGVTVTNVRDALAVYQRSLSTPNAPFDRYLRGDASAISADAKAGYELFRSYGCVSCHQGRNVGGNMYQKLGVMGDYFADHAVTDADLGRFAITGREDDRYVFRVPSLRNVEKTAPYLHDGSAATLEEVVTVMSRYQVGRALTPDQTASIVAFLRTLTGEYKGAPL